MRTHTPKLLKHLPEGNTLEVHFTDGKPSEIILCKILPNECAQDLKSATTETKLVELFTGRDTAYVSSLHEDSFEDILICGRGINDANL